MVVTLFEVMQYRSIIKICQVGHILAFFILGGVDLTHQILLEVLVLSFERETQISKVLLWNSVVLWVGTYIDQFAVIPLA